MAISTFGIGLLIATSPALALAQDAIQYQRGDDNQAELQQLAGIGSVSQQYQDGSDNLSQTTQTGDYNNAQVRQRSSFSEAQVTQDGHYNQLRIYQGSGDWRFGGNGGREWTAEVVQLGNANQVALQQEQGFGSGAYLHQEGNRNVHQVRQSGYPNRLEASSIGDDNRVVSNQPGGFGVSRVAQVGNANQLSIEQWVFPNNGTIEVAQQGFANQASITQNAIWRPVGTLVLAQVGSRNSMTVDHGSGADKFHFTQEGVGNSLYASQHGPVLNFEGHSIGNRNHVSVFQTFYFADLTISQIGDDNFIDAEQWDPDWQREIASIEQIGNANYALLRQVLPGDSYADQIVTIIQHGSGNVASISQ